MSEIVSGSSSCLPFADKLLDTVTALVAASMQHKMHIEGGGMLLEGHRMGEKQRIADSLAVIMDTAVTLHLEAAKDGRELLEARNARMQNWEAARVRHKAAEEALPWRSVCLSYPPGDVGQVVDPSTTRLNRQALATLHMIDKQYMEQREAVYKRLVEANGRDVEISLDMKPTI